VAGGERVYPQPFYRVREESMNMWFAVVRNMSRFLLLIAGVTLAFMFLFTLFNVVMRAFGNPILGDFEIISFLGAVVIGFSIPYTTLLKGHVLVDFVIEKLPVRTAGTMQIFTRILGIALFLWMSWNFVAMSLDLIKSHEVTPVFRLPYYPISFGLAFSCTIQCCTLVSQILETVGGRHE
jgi:TRAP-type C4-dicarboxylate transport system permease small subunit